MDVFFSVIIPTYNRADKLRLSLESLVAQTYKNFEAIVCDDGSTDNTKEIIEEFRNQLDLKYLWSENWGGPAKPRNNGIEVSRGEWICFLDSDDWWYPEKLETCLVYLENNDLIYHDLDIRSETETDPKRKIGSWQLRGNILSDLLISGNAINNSSVIVRKDLLMKVGCFSLDRNLIFLEDFDCWLRISKIESRFFYIEKSLGAYWLGQNSSAASERTIKGIRYIYDKYIPELTEKEQAQALYNQDFTIGLLNYSLKNYKEASSYFRNAFSRKSMSRKFNCLKFILICTLRSTFEKK
jgi:glycosyltransferase involved in cell wall biosynthesis